MDVFRHDGIKQIIVLLSDLDLNDFGLEDEATSHLHTPEETKERGWESHIPPVTTVPREGALLSSDRQARWRPIAVREVKKKTTDPSPAATNGETTEAEASQIHDTPNTVEGARSDDRSSPAAEQGSKVCSHPGVETKAQPPDMVAIRSSTQDVSAPSVATTNNIISGIQPPDMVKSRSSTQDVTGPSVAAKSDKNKTMHADVEEKQTLGKPKSQISATI